MSNITDWIQAVSALIIVFLSYQALSTWRNQKHFETSIDLLNGTQTARDFICLLRDRHTLPSDNAILEEYKKKLKETKWDSVVERNFFISNKNFEFKEPLLSELFREIVKMKTIANSMFGKQNEFYFFYSWIISVRDKVNESYQELYWLELDLLENEHAAVERLVQVEIKKNLRNIIYRTTIDDAIYNEMEEKINLLEKHSRQRQLLISCNFFKMV